MARAWTAKREKTIPDEGVLGAGNSADMGAKIRVDNIHYDLNERDLQVNILYGRILSSLSNSFRDYSNRSVRL